jgi:hypothetical protein
MTTLVGLFFAGLLATFVFAYVSGRSKKRRAKTFKSWPIIGALKLLPWLLAVGMGPSSTMQLGREASWLES